MIQYPLSMYLKLFMSFNRCLFIIILFNRVKDHQLNLFDYHYYNNLRSISEVLDYVCTCKTEYDRFGNLIRKDIECNYGTHQNCKFVVGKQYFCIINPEGQLRRKREVRHLNSLFSNSQTEVELDLVVSTIFDSLISSDFIKQVCLQIGVSYQKDKIFICGS